MAALLLDIRPGDEVILPSFTFVSTANAFVLRGAGRSSSTSDPIP
jgi:dTDP-4-amino-4,6-dideoxygalactose transaminase